jgi:hypothetical protein
MERFNLKKWYEAEGEDQYWIETQICSQPWKVDNHKACETIGESIKISDKNSLDYYELRYHKPWFNEGYTKLSAQQAKLQQLQD